MINSTVKVFLMARVTIWLTCSFFACGFWEKGQAIGFQQSKSEFDWKQI